jgi:GTP-binding protein
VSERLESMSVLRSIRAIERADVVFLVLDAVEGLTEQDARLADLTIQRHKPLVIVVNKWDLFPNKTSKTAKEYTDAIHRNLKSMAFVPVTFVSALENQRVHQLPGFAQDLAQRSSRRVETSKVNAALRAMVQEHTPALIKGKTKRVKFYYATQVAVSPPAFVIKCNVVDELQESYIRYMTNRFREMLGFDSVPIRLFYRPKTEEKQRYAVGHDEVEEQDGAYDEPVFDDDADDAEFVEADEEGGAAYDE